MDVREGVFEELSYGKSVVREFEVVVNGSDQMRKLEFLRRRAEDLQDELDEFNASAKVEIEVD